MHLHHWVLWEHCPAKDNKLLLAMWFVCILIVCFHLLLLCVCVYWLSRRVLCECTYL